MLDMAPEEYRAAIARRRVEIMARVEHACALAGRDPAQVRVMAVSKTVDVEQVVAAIEAGYDCFGENRPQELLRKLEGLAHIEGLAAFEFHMIGNLQTNKIGHVLDCHPAMIHSVSSLELARAIATRAQARHMSQPVLVEVNVSGEQSKSGLTPDQARETIGQIAAMQGIEVRGLMTMAPQGDPTAARETFAGLRALRDELADKLGMALDTLSMGMSEDFEEAIAQGSTIVRLGRVAFDPTFPLE